VGKQGTKVGKHESKHETQERKRLGKTGVMNPGKGVKKSGSPTTKEGNNKARKLHGVGRCKAGTGKPGSGEKKQCATVAFSKVLRGGSKPTGDGSGDDPKKKKGYLKRE